MTIKVKTKRGSRVLAEISKEIEHHINQTPNQGPRGEDARKEMGAFLKEFMWALELAFAAPEPLRRSFVNILRSNAKQTALEMTTALQETTKVFQRRVAAGN